MSSHAAGDLQVGAGPRPEPSRRRGAGDDELRPRQLLPHDREDGVEEPAHGLLVGVVAHQAGEHDGRAIGRRRGRGELGQIDPVGDHGNVLQPELGLEHLPIPV
jgi:hypothetical protein